MRVEQPSRITRTDRACVREPCPHSSVQTINDKNMKHSLTSISIHNHNIFYSINSHFDRTCLFVCLFVWCYSIEHSLFILS